MAKPADVLQRSDVDAGQRVACIAPTVAALLYPVALLALYGGGRLVHDAASLEGALSAWTITLGAAAVCTENLSSGVVVMKSAQDGA